MLNWTGQLSDRAADSGSHVRIPRGAPRVPARIPAPAAERLLDADDDDAGVPEGRLQRAVRTDRGGRRAGRVEDPAGRRRRRLLADPAEGDHDLQPACGSSCRSAPRRSSLGAAYAVWTIATQSHVTNSSVLLILLSVVIFLVGLVSEQISSLRFEGRGEREPQPTVGARHRADLQRAREPAGARRRADAAAPASACWSSTISRRTAPARSPTSSRAQHAGPRRRSCTAPAAAGLGRSYIDGIARAHPRAGGRHLPDGRRPLARSAASAGADRRDRAAPMS